MALHKNKWTEIFNLAKLAEFAEIPNKDDITQVYHTGDQLCIFYMAECWHDSTRKEEIDFNIKFTESECLRRFGK